MLRIASLLIIESSLMSGVSPMPSLAMLLESDFAGTLTEHWRRVPRQPRSVATVDALLTTARRMARHADMAELTLEAVAREAGVTQQATYRYFERLEALTAAFIRLMQVEILWRRIRRMEASRFTSLEALATFTVDSAVADFDAAAADYPVTWWSMYRTMHETIYERLAFLAQATVAVATRDGLCAPGRPILGVEIGLVGLMGSLKMLRRRPPHPQSSHLVAAREALIAGYAMMLHATLVGLPAPQRSAPTRVGFA
jgi:AcrR family transcriptional regulator